MIDFYTSDPEALLDAFVDAISGGRIRTWKLDDEGDFTHSPSQWRDKAWMRPLVQGDRLTFSIVWNGNVRGTKEIYGIYHGRLMEAFMVHFDDMFDRAEATALVTGSDGPPPQTGS